MTNRCSTFLVASLLALSAVAQEVKPDSLIPPSSPHGGDTLRFDPFRSPVGVDLPRRSLIEVEIPSLLDLKPVVLPTSVLPEQPEGTALRPPFWEPYNVFTMGVGLTGGTLGLPILGGVNMISPFVWTNPGERIHLRTGINLMQYGNLSYVNDIVTPWLPVGNNIVGQAYVSGYYEVTPWFRILGDASHLISSGFPRQFQAFLPPDQSVSVGGAVKIVGPLGVAVRREYEFYNGQVVPRLRIEPYIFEEKNPRPYVSKKERQLRAVKAAYGN